VAASRKREAFHVHVACHAFIAVATESRSNVPRLTTGLRPRPAGASAAEIARCIHECPHDRVAVEEQDNTFYLIHFSNDRDIAWVSVNSESPIFVELRLRHVRWMAEHPGWNGWIAF
jgi:hypothetical protein